MSIGILEFLCDYNHAIHGIAGPLNPAPCGCLGHVAQK